MNKEEKLTGITIVPGKGLGSAYFVGKGVEVHTKIAIKKNDINEQIAQFHSIRARAKHDYGALAVAETGLSPADAAIFEIYNQIVDDPVFISHVESTITEKLLDLETSIRMVLDDFVAHFTSSDTQYMRDRSSDIVEVGEKLITYLYKDEGHKKKFSEPVVLIVLRMFTPSDILSYDKSMIQGIVCVSGGKTSHAAILARSYSIPVVSDIRDLQKHITPGEQVFVDADKAAIYIHPAPSTIARMAKQKTAREELDKLKKKWRRPVYTRDGIHIEVMANVSLPDDVEEANDYGSDGVGLVRTEYMLTNHSSFPQEDEQHKYYSAIFNKNGDKHCVVRVMDIGGDKIPECFDMPAEFNPFMGWRAVGILLERRDLFEMQLTAIMKAAGKKHAYSIMLPMVTTLKECLDAKAIIASVAEKLGVKMPSCGVLFEVPLAILELKRFLQAIDFAAIGTNDLIQYLSAADRNNAKVNYLYNPIEPAFLKIIKTAITISNDKGMPLSICGEMAGNPTYTTLLVGMGLRRFSIMPRNIPIIKEMVSKLSYAELAESVFHMESLESTEEVALWLKNMNKRMLGDVFEKLCITAEV